MTLGRREDVGQIVSMGAKGDQEHEFRMEYFFLLSFSGKAELLVWAQSRPARPSLPSRAGVICPDSCPDEGR